MRQNDRLILDRSGQGSVPDGYRLITTEADFLRTALNDDAQVVRGGSLCRWAESFWQSRGWHYSEIRSPIADVLVACPGMTEEQAEVLVLAVGDRFRSLRSPVTALQLLGLVLPEGPWEETPSLEHSAAWLLWVGDAAIPDHAAPLVKYQTAKWETESEFQQRRLYRILSPEESRKTIESWIGLEQSEGTMDLGIFPLDVSQPWQQKARDRWKREVVSNGIAAFRDVPESGMPRRIKEIAADEVCSYCLHHTESVTADLISSLAPFLSTFRAHELMDILPPDPPGEPPQEPEELFDWFVQSYLPYREWQAGGDNAAAKAVVTSLAAGFARWYLNFYPLALRGGSGHQHLAMRRSEALRTGSNDCVTLWIVLDGLHFLDARRLVSEIAEQSAKLQVEQVSTTLTAIPTITRFSKPALMTGLPPAQAEATSPTGSNLTALKENSDPKSRLEQAEKGDAYLWCHTEPDKTYHKLSDRSTIADNVCGVLKSLARKIAQAAEAVPPQLPLRIVISTDHGRMLGSGHRTHAIPDGMEAEGRAAYGTAGIHFGESGVEAMEDDRLVFLHGGRFGLPSDCAVALDDNAFVTSDGKGGFGQFPHGGLFPEEVIIPWIELSRAQSLPALEGTVSGKARPTFDGTITLQLSNLSDVCISLFRLTICLGDSETRVVELEGDVGPYSEIGVSAMLREWPTHEQIREAVAKVTCRLENGTMFETAVRLAMEAEQMYRQDTTLEDLL